MTKILLGIGEEKKKSQVYDEILKLVIGDDGLWTKNQVTVMVPDGKVNWYSKEFLHKLRVSCGKTAAMNAEFVGYRQFMYRVLDTYGIKEPLSDNYRTLLIGDMVGKSRGAKGDVITSLYDAGEYSQVISKLVAAGVLPADLDGAEVDENLAKVKAAYEELLKFSRDSKIPLSLADSKNLLALDGGDNLILQNNYVYCFEFENLNFEDRDFVYDAVRNCERDVTFCIAMPGEMKDSANCGIYKKQAKICKEISEELGESSLGMISSGQVRLSGEENRVIYSNNHSQNMAKLYRVNDVFAETEFVTQYIYNMVEDKENQGNYRLRDFNVVIPEEESYLTMLTGMFNKYNMPYSAREKTRADKTSIGAHILDLLRLVESDYTYPAVQDFLRGQPYKIGAFNVDSCIEKYESCRYSGVIAFCDLIADYVLGKDTEVICQQLKVFDQKMKEAKTAGQRVLALYDFLVEMDTSRRFGIDETLAKSGNCQGDRIQSARNTDMVFRALDEIYMIYGDAEMNSHDFIKLVEFVFARTSISAVRKTVDCVNIVKVGDSAITPRPITLVLGLSEETFPAVPKHFGILNNDALKHLNKSGVIIDDRDAETEIMLLCKTMSQHTEQLILVHPRLSSGYDINFEPYLLNKLVVSVEDPEEVESLKIPAVDLETCKNMKKRIAFRDSEGARDLDPKTAVKLYQSKGKEEGNQADRIQFSVSRLDQFITCPYRHFLNRGLNAKERIQRGPLSLHCGNLMHSLFEDLYWEKSEDGKMDWSAPEMDFEKVFGDNMNKSLEKIQRFLEDWPEIENTGLFAARFLCDYRFTLLNFMGKNSYQVASEKSIEKEKVAVLTDGSKVPYLLVGKIDRVDYDEETKKYTVIDFKTGEPPKVCNVDIPIKDLIGTIGVSVQLPVYLANCEDGITDEEMGNLGYMKTSKICSKQSNAKKGYGLWNVNAADINRKGRTRAISYGTIERDAEELTVAEIVSVNERLMNESIAMILSGKKSITDEEMSRISNDDESSCTYCSFSNCRYRRLVEQGKGESDDI